MTGAPNTTSTVRYAVRVVPWGCLLSLPKKFSVSTAGQEEHWLQLPEVFMRFYSFLTVLLRFSASKKKMSRLIWEAGKSCGQQTNTLLEVLSKSQARMGFMQPFLELIHSQHCRWPTPSRWAFSCFPQPPQWGKKWFLFAQNPRRILEFNFASCFIIVWTLPKTGKETKNPWSMRRKAPGVCTATALFYFYFFPAAEQGQQPPPAAQLLSPWLTQRAVSPRMKISIKGESKVQFSSFRAALLLYVSAVRRTPACCCSPSKCRMAA